jgi:predicted DNA binding CopG/RHH family protein
MPNIFKSPDIKVTLRLPKDLWKRVRMQALNDGVTAQVLVEDTLAARCKVLFDAPKPRARSKDKRKEM